MSSEFVAAAASWFGMDPARLADGVMTTNASGVTLVFKVKLEADDYIGIAERMRALREPTAADDQEDVAGFVPMPTLQEVMRNPVAYYGVVGCQELLERAMVLSKDVRAKVEAEEARRAAPVDVKEAVGEFVWLKPEQLTEQQRVMAVGKNEKTGEYAVMVDDLTEEQKAARSNPVPMPSPGTTA